ncbi:MAG TPA: energy transducer TonB [Steroidobacteraceae bacterium]|jgi:protein TonB|nr:energy transducer TonB [Steroidobacteraceae bacterium]
MNPRDKAQGGAPRELAQSEGLSRWLVRHAARSSPAALANRLEEEWLADLAAQRGALSRLHFALGCCWAMRVIARDYVASAARASEPATEHGAIILGQYGPPSYVRRTTILFLIVCLHVIVIYGFTTGLAQKVIQAMPGPMKTTIIDQPRAHALPPPKITASLTTPNRILALVSPAFEFPPDAIEGPVIPSAPPQQQPTPIPAGHSKAIVRILGGPGQGFPNTDDYYPLTARRLGETGVATVRVCVDDRGRLSSAPAIARSSGSARLDTAALRLASAGSGHYRSTTEDGKPVAYCYPYRIRFQLKE